MRRSALVLALVFVVCGGPLRADSFEEGLTAFRAGEPGRAHDIWLPLAGEGDAAAQYSLGKLFEHGEGPIPQDLTKAVYWYRSAASQGLPAAQNNLALMYAQGRGVPGDLNSAIELWRAAAEQSYPWAQYNLGLAYFRGQGVAIHQDEAAKWFRRAADGGLAEAQFIMGQLRREGLGLDKDEGRALAWYHRAADQGHLRARKQANALRAAGVEPKPPTSTETADIPVEELTASLPKPSGSRTDNETAIRNKPQNATREQSGRSKPKAKDDAKGGAKQPRLGTQSEKKRKASADAKAKPKTQAGQQMTARPDTAKQEDQTKAKPKPKVKPEPAGQQAAEAQDAAKSKTSPKAKASTKRQTATTNNPTGAQPRSETAPPAERKAKARPKGRPKPKTSVKQQTAKAQAALGSQEGAKTAQDKPRPIVKPDTKQPMVEMPAESTSKTHKPPEPLAVQSAALPPDGEKPGDAKAAGSYRVWLASAGSKAQAAKLWRQVQDRHPDILSGADVGYGEVDLGGQTLFRVLVGPLASAAEAEQLCERLRSAEPEAFCKVRAD